MRAVLTRLAGASVRAALVAITIAIPAVMLPNVSPTSAELSILVAAIAAAFVIFEYGFATPSLIEFRFAAPYNRCRFAILAMLLIILATAFRAPSQASVASATTASLAVSSLAFWDFTASPLQGFLALAQTTGAESQSLLANASALALSVAAVGVAVLGLVVWSFGWPAGRGKFNLWVNMPTFDIGGGQTLPHLRRTALISLMFGLSFPYLAPPAALAFFGPLAPVSASNSQFLVWLIAIWCFVPAASLLRAIALFRVISLMSRNEPEEP